MTLDVPGAMHCLKVILVNGCCCFWLPMIFFFAADNVLEKCERYVAGLIGGLNENNT